MRPSEMEVKRCHDPHRT